MKNKFLKILISLFLFTLPVHAQTFPFDIKRSQLEENGSDLFRKYEEIDLFTKTMDYGSERSNAVQLLRSAMAITQQILLLTKLMQISELINDNQNKKTVNQFAIRECAFLHTILDDFFGQANRFYTSFNSGVLREKAKILGDISRNIRNQIRMCAN